MSLGDGPRSLLHASQDRVVKKLLVSQFLLLKDARRFVSRND